MHTSDSASLVGALLARLERELPIVRDIRARLQTCSIELRDVLDDVCIQATFTGGPGWREIAPNAWRDEAFSGPIVRTGGIAELPLNHRLDCTAAATRK